MTPPMPVDLELLARQLLGMPLEVTLREMTVVSLPTFFQRLFGAKS